jgi:hypothetical protein
MAASPDIPMTKAARFLPLAALLAAGSLLVRASGEGARRLPQSVLEGLVEQGIFLANNNWLRFKGSYSFRQGVHTRFSISWGGGAKVFQENATRRYEKYK